MKFLILGLEGLGPEQLLEVDRLSCLQALKESGGYGPLESVFPPESLPSWSAFETGRHPAVLGLYGGVKRVGPPLDPNVLLSAESPAPVPMLADLLGTDQAPPIRVGTAGARAGDADDQTGEPRLGELAAELVHRSWRYAQMIDPSPAHLRGAGDADALEAWLRAFDQELAALLDHDFGDLSLLIVSPIGAVEREGAIALNRWLRRQGDLVVTRETSGPLAATLDAVDWSRTRAWIHETPSGAHFHINLEGRERPGVVKLDERDSIVRDYRERIEAARDELGRPLEIEAIDPRDLEPNGRGNPPDLILAARGFRRSFIDQVDDGPVLTAPDPARRWGPSPHGAFLLASSQGSAPGALTGARLIDLAPTLLEIAALERPEGLPGTPLGADRPGPADEQAVLDRLRGLGYIS